MSDWNYVVTVHKPTNVTHSRVGNFTGNRDVNLIIAKCTRIEIHKFTDGVLQLVLDVPIYGRIATLELFRPHGEKLDFLFIATESYTFCVLQWDTRTSTLITRAMQDVSDPNGCPTYNGQIVTIDPEHQLIGLHLYAGLLKVFPFDKNGNLNEPYDIRIERQVLDIKFLYGCVEPTIAILYKNEEDDVRNVKTYQLRVEHMDKVEGPFNWTSALADFLIPVPQPLCGVLLIGIDSIVHLPSRIEAYTDEFFWRVYGRVHADGSRYLLGGHAGLLHKLIITHKGDKVTGYKLEHWGETSIASTISYLENEFVFIGSSCGDSQLIKLNRQRDANTLYVEVLERYVNLAPIVDFCVVDLESQGQRQVVTCSGAYKDGSLRIVEKKIGFNELASVGFEGIGGMWPLRSSTDGREDTFLAVSFINEVRIFEMSQTGGLEEAEIEGVCTNVRTLFCHNAVCNQLVQVTSSSVRLISSTSRKLLNEWHCRSGSSINVATANATQVLLATDDHGLVYLTIGNGILEEAKQVLLEHEISCLDITPIVEKTNSSALAAVGMWREISVRIYSLPDLNCMTTEELGGEIISRSVLLCAFEGIPYLLCALGDGHLLNFLLDTSTGVLTDMKKVYLGTQSITLHTFSFKNTTSVLAASDRPTVIYSSNKKLLYIKVNLKEVSHMCPFNPAICPDSLAIAKVGKLTFGTIDDILDIHPIRFGEHARCICHQEQSSTFAICSAKYDQSYPDNSVMQDLNIHLLDDKTFDLKSTYELPMIEESFLIECGCSILSCSFSNDSNVYYCVGTVYIDRFESKQVEPTRGRILIFKVEREGKLRLIAENETTGAVYSLNAFNGKLLAVINKEIQLYKWMLLDDGSVELQYECGHHGHIHARYVQTKGDFIVVGDRMKSISLLIYNHVRGAIEEQARDNNTNWMSAVEILDENIYLGADNNFNLFTVQKNSEGATDKESGRLEVVGKYHLGEFVYRFRHGSLDMRFPNSDVGQIPTVIFGTDNGVIGVIASLPHEQYKFLEKLQSNLRKVTKGVGWLGCEEWRSFNNGKKTVDDRNMLDGDLIESFVNLTPSEKNKISVAMSLSVGDLSKRVKELMRLH